MSLKPPKKSDLDKSWMKPRLDRYKKIHPEYHLIVTEGTVTEPAYFVAIKNLINATYPDRIQVEIEGAGENTLRLFQRAKSLARSSSNGYKHVWVVYDTDDFPQEYIDQTVLMCEKESTSETTYHAIWSNQCIELWFLLHFCYLQSDINRKAYWPKLTKYLTDIGQGKYKKNREDIYSILEPYMDTAISNAEKLALVNRGKQPSEAAPGTMVHELVKKLRPYLS